MRDKINDAILKWKLNHIEVIYEHSTKGVFSAESEDFGPVILKFDQNRQQLGSEYKMLSRLSDVTAAGFMRLMRPPDFSWKNTSSRGQCCAGKHPWKRGFRFSYRCSRGFICLRIPERLI